MLPRPFFARQSSPESQPDGGLGADLSPLARAVFLATCVVTAGLPAYALAAGPASSGEQAARSYHIAAGPLGTVLSQFAAEAGVMLSFDAAQTRGLSSPGLRGTYTPHAGLATLLAGSDLDAAALDGGRYVLVKRPKVVATDEGAMLQEVNVNAVAERGATTEGSRSYTTRAMSTSSRLALSPRETPQSVSVITRQQIEDRNFVTLDDAMEVATGITSSTANFNRISYTARGFSLTDNMIDGMPGVGSAYAGYVPNLAFYDRVEVIRGAAGLAYGAGSAGGAVNLVRKRPTAEPRVSVALRAGTWNNYYAEIDGSGALSADGSVRGRLVVAYEDRENFIELEASRKPAIYGILEADIGKSTVVHVGGSMERYDGNYAPYGLPRYKNGGDLGLSRSSRGMTPAWTDYYTEADTLFAGLDHQFNSRWNLKLAGSYQKRVQGGLTFNSTGAVDPVTLTGPAYSATVSDSDSPDERLVFDAMLTGAFDAFGRQHEVVLGGTWSETETQRSRSATGPAPAITQTIFDFDPRAVPRPVLGPWTSANSSSVATSSGVFAVTRLSLAERLKLILGGRVSTAKNETYTYSTDKTVTAQEKNVFTPYGGVIYDFAQRWSAYASYSDIFRVQNTLYTASGNPLEPVVGANYEAGVKGEFYDGRLNTSFAVFRIEEENRSQVDPNNQLNCAGSPSNGACYIAEGKVRGEGFETELSGEIVPGWEAVAGYTFVKTEYLHDRAATGLPSGNQGKSFRTTTPEHLLKIWTSYRLPGALERWSVGGGVNTQSEIYTQSGAVRIEQGGYSIWGARLGYKLDKRWALGLNVNNVFDKHYYLRVGTVGSGNRYGEPRNVMLTLRGSF